MSEPITGVILSDSDNGAGKSTVEQIDGRINSTPGGSFEPEIIRGTDTFDPVTERFRTDTGGSGDSTRRTKTGRIDRRTRAGRSGGGITDTTGGIGESETPASSSVNLEKVNLTDLLLSLHAMGAAFLSTPELELDRDEAKKLSDGIQKVGKYYAMAFDPKKVAIAELAIIAGGIYGTRFVAWKNRKNQEGQESKPAPGPTLVQRPAAPEQPAKPLHMTSPSELWPEGGGHEGALPI
jgi:hypothetical protein